jgi:hypothetical protein
MAVEDPNGSVLLCEDAERSRSDPESRIIWIDQLIERWWDDHFPGSAIARDTQAWNVAHAAKEMLKRLLKGSI